MKLMPTRYDALIGTFEAFKETGVYFILKKGNLYEPLWGGDDLGLFFFAPLLSKTFGLDIDISYQIFFLLVIIFSFLVSCYYFIFFEKSSLKLKIYSILSIFFCCYISYKIGDVYILSAVIPLLVIPLFFISMKTSFFKAGLIQIIIGILVSYSNYIRSHSGTTALVFIALYFIFNKEKIIKKLIFIILILVGFMIPKLHFNHMIEKRDNFLKAHQNIAKTTVKDSHVFWHNTFLGLGFIYNKHGIVPKDEIAFEWARRVNSRVEYMSVEYENILKNEFFSFIKSHPGYVLNNYLAKLGIIMFYIICSINIGFLERKYWNKSLLIPFLFSIGFGSLPGFIFLPYNSYLLGAIAMSVVFANISLLKCFQK